MPAPNTRRLLQMLPTAVGGWTHIAKDKGVASAAISKKKGVAVAAIAKIKGVAV